MTASQAFDTVSRSETCSVSAVRRVAAMLDLPPDDLRPGDPLPKGWHFLLMGADTRRSELRADGYPGLGVPMPDLGLPRLLIGGRTVDYLRAIPIGSDVLRTSGVTSLARKTTAAGAMAIVDVKHTLAVAGESDAAIVETQRFVLLEATPRPRTRVEAAARNAVAPEHEKVLVPDETLLFQYSALGFNSHRIHIDKAYAREVEGFPDLVVNGGLTTLLMTEFARNELGLDLKALRMKNVAPLFCGRPLTLTAERAGAHWQLHALDDAGTLAADMEVDLE
jgi:3-methylfumaryl-CoA hydratase